MKSNGTVYLDFANEFDSVNRLLLSKLKVAEWPPLLKIGPD